MTGSEPCPCCMQVGDQVVVDGGMVSLEAVSKAGPDVRCRVVDPGIILSRANLTFHRGGAILRARNAMLPVLSSKASLSQLVSGRCHRPSCVQLGSWMDAVPA